MDTTFFDDVFNSDQPNLLKAALERAISMVADEYQVGPDVETKLAKIIIAIVPKRLAGGELYSAGDADDIAFTASERLLSLRADKAYA